MRLPVTFTVEIVDQDHVLTLLTFTAASAELGARRDRGQRTALWVRSEDGEEHCLLGPDEIAFSIENATLIEMLRSANGGTL